MTIAYALVMWCRTAQIHGGSHRKNQPALCQRIHQKRLILRWLKRLLTRPPSKHIKEIRGVLAITQSQLAPALHNRRTQRDYGNLKSSHGSIDWPTIDHAVLAPEWIICAQGLAYAY